MLNGSRGAGRAAAALVAVLGLAASACGRPEDPARAALRARLGQEARLSNDELAQVRDEVRRAIEGKTYRLNDADGAREMTSEQRTAIFEMLTHPAGMYDEGLRREAGATVRVLNAPGRSNNAEIEATQRLWIDVATFAPRKYLFTYAFPGYGDYAFDLEEAR